MFALILSMGLGVQKFLAQHNLFSGRVWLSHDAVEREEAARFGQLQDFAALAPHPDSADKIQISLTPSGGKLIKITQKALTDVTVADAQGQPIPNIAAFMPAYSVNLAGPAADKYGEGDVLMTADGLTYVHSGNTAGTAADWFVIPVPSQNALLNLLSVEMDSGLTFNPGTGVLDWNGVESTSIAWNGASAAVKPAFVRGLFGLGVAAPNDAQLATYDGAAGTFGVSRSSVRGAFQDSPDIVRGTGADSGKYFFSSAFNATISALNTYMGGEATRETARTANRDQAISASATATLASAQNLITALETRLANEVAEVIDVTLAAGVDEIINHTRKNADGSAKQFVSLALIQVATGLRVDSADYSVAVAGQVKVRLDYLAPGAYKAIIA